MNSLEDASGISTDALNPPYGGKLIDLIATDGRAAELKRFSATWPSWTLTPRQLCDLELLMTGGFSPLRGFMTRSEYDSVCHSMRLQNGVVWPIPIVLDVTEETVRALGPGGTLALRDAERRLLAVLHVDDVWRPDKSGEAQAVYGTASGEHPGVATLDAAHAFYVGGRVEAIEPPAHADFRALRRTPAELRAEFAAQGWTRVVAFQTRNPMHRAHVELTRRALGQTNAKLLIQPVVGMTKPGDVDHYTRVRCYQAVLHGYQPGSAKLALLPLAMRMAGPREALWHAIIRRNYGCTHLIVGRDHAGPGSDSRGVPFYSPYAAQELLREHQREIGVHMVPSRDLVYLAEPDQYVPEDEVLAGARVSKISGTELRRRLATGEHIPDWFSFPDVVKELRRTHPPRSRQGFTVFFTGLSGAGKSTIAEVLRVLLLERGDRVVTMLDGDVVRTHLSSELGFSKEHRDLNIGGELRLLGMAFAPDYAASGRFTARRAPLVRNPGRRSRSPPPAAFGIY